MRRGSVGNGADNGNDESTEEKCHQCGVITNARFAD
jgi:hypothetical protein